MVRRGKGLNWGLRGRLQQPLFLHHTSILLLSPPPPIFVPHISVPCRAAVRTISAFTRVIWFTLEIHYIADAETGNTATPG